MRESPAGDELFFLSYVNGRSFGSMWDLVVNTEKTPPVGFVLGWLAARLGPADPWMRLPSVLAGTALVPAVALLGRRCVGPACGLIAAALAACSPLLLFYGIESRAYSLAALLSCASVVLLLAAVDRGGKLRWVGWVLLTALAHPDPLHGDLRAVRFGRVGRGDPARCPPPARTLVRRGRSSRWPGGSRPS